MAKSALLRARDIRAIVNLVGECRELGDDRLAWREHAIGGLEAIVDAPVGCIGEMADCLALRPKDLGVLHWGWQNGFYSQGLSDVHLAAFQANPNYSPTLLDFFRRLNSTSMCLSRREVLEDRPWYASTDYQFVQRSYGVDHILWCFHPIPRSGPDVFAGLVLNRAEGSAPFSARDCTIVREAHFALTALIGGPLARFADPSPADLPPRVRQVLACLLEGDGDKHVAARLRLSSHTVNQYTKAIFRHFGVNSRAALLARWIRRGWPVGPWDDKNGTERIIRRAEQNAENPDDLE